MRDLLTDDDDNFDLVGVTMFCVTAAFIVFGGYDLYALHEEYRLMLAKLPENVPIPAQRAFDLQGWGIGAAALLGGHGINRFSRRDVQGE